MLIQRLLTLAFVLGSVLPAAKADTMTFSSSSSFLAQLGSQFTDNYSDAVYPTDVILPDDEMSQVLNETTYHATGQPQTNIVSQGPPFATYCAGCEGSFRLGFTHTTVGDPNGVFGVGFNVITFQDPPLFLPVSAYVTFGDLTHASFLLADGTSYFGITSTLEIRSIDVGSDDGSPATDISVEIGNLTIGAAPVPEPAGWLLLATVTGLVALLCRNRASRPARPIPK